MNSYFDSDSFNAYPIVQYMKPYYLTSSEVQSNYYYLKVSFNNAIINDNILFGSAKNLTFIETDMDYFYQQNIVGLA